MEYKVIYSGETMDINDVHSISLEIYKYTDEDVTVKELTLGGDNPIMIEYDDNGEMFKPLIQSTCTVKLVTDKPLLDLYTGKLNEICIKVYQDGELFWYGFLTPNIYSSDYEAGPNEFELEFIDVVAHLENVKFEKQFFYKSFIEYFNYALNRIDLLHTIKGYVNQEDGIDLKTMGVMERNFIDETDDEKNGAITANSLGISYIKLSVEEKIVDGFWYLPVEQIIPIQVYDEPDTSKGWMYMKSGQYEFNLNFKLPAGDYYSYITIYSDRNAETVEKLFEERTILSSKPKETVLQGAISWTKPEGWYLITLEIDGTLNEPWTLNRLPTIEFGSNTIEIGETKPLDVTTTPNELIVYYKSSNEDIISIDDYGYITAHNPGKVTITVNVPGQSFNGDIYTSKTASVDITAQLTFQTEYSLISVDSPIKVNMAYEVFFNYSPKTYNLNKVIIESSDRSIASIEHTLDSFFYLYANKAGKSTITFKMPGYTENGATYLPSEFTFDVTVID